MNAISKISEQIINLEKAIYEKDWDLVSQSLDSLKESGYAYSLFEKQEYKIVKIINKNKKLITYQLWVGHPVTKKFRFVKESYYKDHLIILVNNLGFYRYEGVLETRVLEY